MIVLIFMDKKYNIGNENLNNTNNNYFLCLFYTIVLKSLFFFTSVIKDIFHYHNLYT